MTRVLAGREPENKEADCAAFLLNNTNEYHLAHLVGLTEYFLSSYFWPEKFNSVFASPWVLVICELHP